MQVFKYGQKAKKVCQHYCCAGNSWYVEIPEDKLKPTLGDYCEVVTCPVPLGGILFIDQLIPHRSLDNNSQEIRWSIDLRWQRPDEAHGFFGNKKPILLRTARDPNYKPDFPSWDAVDLPKMDSTSPSPNNEDPFNTVISGPWMKRWQITKHNMHTKTFAEGGEWTGWHKA